MPRCVHLALLSVLTLASCSRQWSIPKEPEIPGSFAVNGKRYITRLDAPGVVDDDAVRYSADAGARSFYFQDRKLLRNLFVGRWDDFDSLEPAELEETRGIAKTAIALLEQCERSGKPLPKSPKSARRSFGSSSQNESLQGLLCCWKRPWPIAPGQRHARQ
jgi:hypothetical protein